MHTYRLKPAPDGQVYVLDEANDTAAIAPSWAQAKRIKRGLQIVDELARQRAVRKVNPHQPVCLRYRR